MENTKTYHEIDFLLPAQRFNIKFSYISQKGMPFVREFVLRLVNLAPMSKSQIATFFGFSVNEVEEAIADLVDRDELILNENGRLTLSEKSRGYFSDIGEVPRLSVLLDSSARLPFDLATFTCLGKDIPAEKWKAGIKLKVDNENIARSEEYASKHFQNQFNGILQKGYFSKSLIQDDKDSPTIYTVNSVNKLRDLPLRLPVKFELDNDGRSVEREDFEILRDSDYVQEKITEELHRLNRPSNLPEIAKTMIEIGDQDTIKVLDLKSNLINLQFFDELSKLEANNKDGRITFLGPIYSKENWGRLQKQLAPILKSRIERKADIKNNSFIWIAPSDPYWSKSNQLLVSTSDFFGKSETKEKKLYSPTLYLPIANHEDVRTAKQWKHELGSDIDRAFALLQGFLEGNVEILLLEGELVVVVYHLSLPGSYPVSLPIGFMSKNPKHILSATALVEGYLQGSAGFEKPNDMGAIAKFIGGV